jgi:tetratricopeptide (TPR) repeat protein
MVTYPTAMLSWAMLAALLVLSPGALAQELSASASPESVAPAIPLPELPKLAPISKVAATPAAVQNLEGRLDELVNTSVSGPLDEVDMRFLTSDLDPAIVPAIAQRFQELREELEGEKARRRLDAARKAGRKAIRKRDKGKKKSEKGKQSGDWLVFILALENHDDHWRHAIELYGMLRMLEAVGSTPAVRQMVACYSFFGELVRIDLQRAIGRLKDKAVPALMEAKKHDAKKVQRWARRQLDGLGRAIPGEAVSTTDHVILADVLRAFGRIRDVDATRVVLSFANSEDVQLRDAAREAITALGAPAYGHFKDSYKNLTGKRPPHHWGWERTVKELFRLYDRGRLSQLYELLDKGKKALADKKYQDATSAFDSVLARAPLFKERAAMAPAYLGRAEELLAEKKYQEAAPLLRTALRLAPKGADNKKIESKLLMLEGRALIEAGTPDRFVLARALELDPENAEAKELLQTVQAEAEQRQQKTQRYIGAVGVGLIALIAIIVLARRPKTEVRRPKSEVREPKSEVRESDDRVTEVREPRSESREPEDRVTDVRERAPEDERETIALTNDDGPPPGGSGPDETSG